ncbi:MAG: hypothetical protein IJW55_09875 [Clostridia bacterium]|nr:hypothetical protein [Clostridia bacterium]MBQ7348254.1 hypothetical protein [Clostridia bacterium]
MNKNVKIAIGVGIAAAAVTVITIGIIRQLKAIKTLTIDADEIPDELGECDIELDEADVAEAEEAAE